MEIKKKFLASCLAGTFVVGGLLGTLGGGITGFVGGFAKGLTQATPYFAAPVIDLNEDGINDLALMQQDGYIIPMFGFEDEYGISYLEETSHREYMLSQDPYYQGKYDGIEELLNE